MAVSLSLGQNDLPQCKARPVPQVKYIIYITFYCLKCFTVVKRTGSKRTYPPIAVSALIPNNAGTMLEISNITA